MKWKFYLGVAIVIIATLCLLSIQQSEIKRLREEMSRYERNTETLLSDIHTYKVRDSLSAARVNALELSVKEFERFRAEDASLIREMTAKNRDLSAINKTQAETILKLRATPKDTVIIRDSIRVNAKKVSCGDYWYTFEGLMTDDEFTGTLANRDSLLLVESVRYKRFLFWKTKKVKDRQLDVASKNPHTTILGIENIVIEK